MTAIRYQGRNLQQYQTSFVDWHFTTDFPNPPLTAASTSLVTQSDWSSETKKPQYIIPRQQGITAEAFPFLTPVALTVLSDWTTEAKKPQYTIPRQSSQIAEAFPLLTAASLTVFVDSSTKQPISFRPQNHTKTDDVCSQLIQALYPAVDTFASQSRQPFSQKPFQRGKTDEALRLIQSLYPSVSSFDGGSNRQTTNPRPFKDYVFDLPLLVQASIISVDSWQPLDFKAIFAKPRNPTSTDGQENPILPTPVDTTVPDTHDPGWDYSDTIKLKKGEHLWPAYSKVEKEIEKLPIEVRAAIEETDKLITQESAPDFTPTGPLQAKITDYSKINDSLFKIEELILELEKERKLQEQLQQENDLNNLVLQIQQLLDQRHRALDTKIELAKTILSWREEEEILIFLLSH